MVVPFIVVDFTDSNIEVKVKPEKSAELADKIPKMCINPSRATVLEAKAPVPMAKAPVLGLPARLPMTKAGLLAS